MAKTNFDYGYYSKQLNQPFDTLEALRAAEAGDRKAKDEKALAAKAKKDAAAAVEDAYKNLNAAKRKYKEDLSHAIVKYTEAMKIIKGEFTAEKEAIVNALAAAEINYQDKLKEFTDKHPEGFHITLKDGDYETSISSLTNKQIAGDWISQLYTEFFES